MNQPTTDNKTKSHQSQPPLKLNNQIIIEYNRFIQYILVLINNETQQFSLRLR